MHKSFVLLATLAVSVGFSQESEAARRVYAQASGGVFLVVVTTAEGRPICQATGFLVAGNRIVTNEHVVRAGIPYLQIGSARVSLTVSKTDLHNDLAVLVPAGKFSGVPLKFSSLQPQPGATVFALGNPEGLVRSISSGIVAGIRDTGGRELLQGSAPISPGSSGGPVLDASGEVVGATVGMLESGQNLNFAEPAKFVLQLLGEEISQPAQAAEASHAAAEPIKDRVNTNKTKPETLQSLLSQLEDLRNSGRLRNKDSALDAGIDAEALLIQALELAGSDASQLGLVEDVAERTSRSMGLWQTVETIAIAKIAVLAAERILKEPKFRISGYVKYANALLAQFVADTDEAHRYEDRGNAKENPTLIRAEKAIREACKLKGQPTTEMYLVLGEVLAASSQPEESRKTYIKAYERARLENDSLSIHSAIRGIINADSNLKTFVDSDHWFQTLADTEGGPIFFEWYDQAKRLSDRKEYERSGDIYVNAAAQASREGMLPWDSLCSAAEAYFRAQDADKLLDAARSCIDKAARIEGTSDRIAKAHFIIADTLNRRGVYEEGLAHANEAVALDSSDAFYYDALADSLIGLRRFKDAIKASKESVRLSDGKYSYMHFTLGTGYFELKNWDAARQSFEEAAELAPTNDAAAYNVALCLMHLGFDQDAASWYEEVLRRNPNPKQKQEILNRIRALRH